MNLRERKKRRKKDLEGGKGSGKCHKYITISKNKL